MEVKKLAGEYEPNHTLNATTNLRRANIYSFITKGVSDIDIHCFKMEILNIK